MKNSTDFKDKLNSNGYRLIKKNEYHTMKLYLSEVHEMATYLKRDILNKRFIFETQSGSKVNVIFRANNYAHLCGIVHIHGASAFFNEARRDRLKILVLKKMEAHF